MDSPERASEWEARPEVRAAVLELLERSPAYRELSEEDQRGLAEDMVNVADFIVAGPSGATIPGSATVVSQSGATMTNLVNAVDFPAFVAGLVQGVFNAVVNASIRQMEAYGDLLKDVSQSVDRLRCTVVCASRAASAAAGGLDAQQEVAIQLVTGINRIVVTDGPIAATVVLEPAADSILG